jgi:hypothetical protein
MARAPAPAIPFKHRSAWLPVAISVFFIALALRHVALVGPGVAEVEGTEAHLFQLLMPAQVLIILYCAYMWLPRSPQLRSACSPCS